MYASHREEINHELVHGIDQIKLISTQRAWNKINLCSAIKGMLSLPQEFPDGSALYISLPSQSLLKTTQMQSSW